MSNDPIALMTPEKVEKLKTAMFRTYFSAWNKDFLASPEGKAPIDAQTTGRYFDCLRDVVPWVGRHIDLSKADIIEVGCGAGASTAAFAHYCRRIVGIDIDDKGIEGAKLRMEILGLTNVELESVTPETFLGAVRRAGAHGADVVFLYAVIEHQTTQERIETLKLGWELLRDGGLLVVADTPSRLTYTDHHTAMLPFYHLLPHDLAVAYACKSPRAAFPESIAEAAKKSPAAAEERLVRWGRGASYHEFELAIGDLTNLVVGDGFDPEMLRTKPVTVEERVLYTYAKAVNLRAPEGFLRQSIDVILKKGSTQGVQSRAADAMAATV